MKKQVLFICSAQKNYTRNEFIVKILNKKYSLKEISSNQKTYFKRSFFVFKKFIFLKNKKEFDFIYVGFLAQILLPFIRLFYKKKIIADYFISLYDTLCFDRKIFKADSLIGKAIFFYEKWTLKMADEIIVDTENSKQFFIDTYKISSKIKVIYVFANREIFYYQKKKEQKKYDIFFYGSGQSLHGIDIILKAAKLLEKNNFSFLLIGPIKKKYKKLIDNLKLKNVFFIDWVEYKKLAEFISFSDICLGGHFGNTEKAKRVIAGKTFQFANMKKAVILGLNKANKELFKDREDCLMVRMNDEEALAKAIKKLKEDKNLKIKISENIYTLIKEEELRAFNIL